MYKSNAYPFQSLKPTPNKKQKLHAEINKQIRKHFTSFDDYVNAETVWLSMKEDGFELSISSFYNRLKELVEAGAIAKKPNGYNKFVYKLAVKS